MTLPSESEDQLSDQKEDAIKDRVTNDETSINTSF